MHKFSDCNKINIDWFVHGIQQFVAFVNLHALYRDQSVWLSKVWSYIDLMWYYFLYQVLASTNDIRNHLKPNTCTGLPKFALSIVFSIFAKRIPENQPACYLWDLLICNHKWLQIFSRCWSHCVHQPKVNQSLAMRSDNKLW